MEGSALREANPPWDEFARIARLRLVSLDMGVPCRRRLARWPYTMLFPLARATRFLQADASVFDERNFTRLGGRDLTSPLSSRFTERRQRVNITGLSPWPPTRMRTKLALAFAIQLAGCWRSFLANLSGSLRNAPSPSRLRGN